MSSSYKCECFSNRYLCCISGGCYYFPVGYTCSFSMTLSSTPTCTCYPSRYVCCYDKGCYYKEPYNCTGSNPSAISKNISSPTCLCYPNKYVCNNEDMWFRITDTINCYAPSPTASTACSCYPGKYEICCNEATCSYYTSCSSIEISPTETITQTHTVTSVATTTVTTTTFVSSPTSSEINVTAIVLGVVIPIAAIILTLILIWFYFKRKRIFQRKEEDKQFNVSNDRTLKKENIKRNEQVNENLINLKFGEDPISKSSLYKREEIGYKDERKEESKDKEEEIADDILVVKREKEKEQQQKIFLEENEDIQKGIGLKSDIFSSSKK